MDKEAERIKQEKMKKMLEALNKPKNSVIIYSTTNCPWCFKAKQYFQSLGIAFTDYNVAENREKAAEMIRKTGQQGVPVIEVNGKIIIGFNKFAIDSALNR